MSKYKEVERILSGTDYAVLHGWESLPERLRSDLDIAIDPADIGKLEDSLMRYGSWRLVQMLQHESSCFYFIVAVKDGGGTDFLQLDAATDYRRNGFTYFSADEMIEGRKKWRGFWVASPETEFAYLLVKKTLKGRTPAHQRRRLSELVEELGVERSRHISAGLLGDEPGRLAVSWISAERWRALESNTRAMRRNLILETVRRDPMNPLRYWHGELKRVVKRWRYPTGLFVAVLGPDGAGKSTLIKNLEKGLSGAFRRTESYHLRPGLLGGAPEGPPVTDPHGKPPRSAPASALKIAYYCADYAVGYVMKLYPKLVRSTLVTFDRYYDDLLVDPVRYRYGGPAWLARLARRAVPAPDVMLVLDSPGDVLLQRKREVTEDILRSQRRAYKELALGRPDAYILDARREAGRLAGDAEEILLDHLHERYAARRGVWFGGGRRDGLEDFLTSALSADPEKAVFVSGKTGREGEWETLYEFSHLPVRGGRGYLLPQRGKAASSALELYNAQKGKAKALKSLLRTAYRAGMGGVFTKRMSVIARKGAVTPPAGDPTVFGRLKEIFGYDQLEFALSLGTPGAARKPVIQILTPDGGVIGYAKVGRDGITNRLVENEARALKYLPRENVHSFSAPSVLHAEMWHGRSIVILSPQKGIPEAPPTRLTLKYADTLCELAGLDTSHMRLRESPFWRSLLYSVRSVKNRYYRGILVRNVISAMDRGFLDTPLPFHIAHGDFAPWNTYSVKGKLFVYDWEYSRRDMPPGWDLFHFILQTGGFLEEKNPGEIHQALLSDSFSGPARLYWEKLRIPQEALKPLAAIYVGGRLAFAASEGRSPSRELNRLTKILLLLRGN